MLAVIPYRQSWYTYLCLSDREGGQRQTSMFCCFSVCLPLRTLLGIAMKTDTWNNFSLQLFVQLYEKGQMQHLMWSSLNVTAAETDKLALETLNIGLKMLRVSDGVQTKYSLFKGGVCNT